METATFAKSPFLNQTTQNSGITGPPAFKKCQSSKILHNTPKRSYLPGVCLFFLVPPASRFLKRKLARGMPLRTSAVLLPTLCLADSHREGDFLPLMEEAQHRSLTSPQGCKKREEILASFTFPA